MQTATRYPNIHRVSQNCMKKYTSLGTSQLNKNISLYKGMSNIVFSLKVGVRVNIRGPLTRNAGLKRD